MCLRAGKPQPQIVFLRINMPSHAAIFKGQGRGRNAAVLRGSESFVIFCDRNPAPSRKSRITPSKKASQMIHKIPACLSLGLVLLSAGMAQAEQGLALGDGKISTTPKRGYVMSCQQHFNANGPGAFASGDWLQGKLWYPSRKPTVDGSVKWSGGGLKVSVTGSSRVLSSNALPDHRTGVYPVARSDDAYNYDRNPNRITKSAHRLTLPATPTEASAPSCLPMGQIGVALTGAAIYNALDARGEDAGAHEIQDSCAGHPERTGEYHYHTASKCMTPVDGLIGYALDGFGIYAGPVNGKTLSNADLDACHGIVSEIEWDGKKVEMYHYQLTADYPYTLGCFKGTPVN
jgi:hypothetical protein